MISPFEEVKISNILHKTIYRAEKDLKNVTRFPFFLQKNQLSKVLLSSIVRFSRFLVAYRWHKYRPQINEIDFKSSFFNLEKYIYNLMNQLKHFHLQIQQNQQHSFFNPEFLFFEHNAFYPIFDNRTLTKYYNQENRFQIIHTFLGDYRTIRHIQAIKVIKKFIVINAYPHYHLTLKIKSKAYHIYRLSIYWNKNFFLSADLLKKIIAQLEPFDLERPNELSRIDSILFSFSVISFFGSIIQKLSEHADDFKCTISRIDNISTLIAFPDTYQPFNQFILKVNLNSNRIEIHSKAPLYPPPDNPRTIYEVFKKLNIDKFTPTEVYCRTIDITDQFRASELLTQLRNRVFYTNALRFWYFLISAMRSAPFSHLRIYLKCDSDSILDIKIYFPEIPLPLLTITFNSTDGLPIFIPISNYYNLGKQPLFLDAKKIFISVFSHFIEHINFSHIFKNHIFYLMRKFELKEATNVRFHFSFSDHFFIDKINNITYPKFILRSYDSPENLNPRTLLIKILSRSNDMDMLVTHISITSKIYLILLELENKLKSKGIISKRNLNTIYVPSIGCKFKIDINEFWTLSFERPLFQYLDNGRIIILGNKLSLRFVDSIFNLMSNYFYLGSLIYSARHLIIHNNDYQIYLKPFGHHFIIMYEPYNNNFYQNGRLFHYFTLFPFRYPSIQLKALYYTPFSNYAQSIEYDYNELSAYFSRFIYIQLKICQIFKSKKWKIIPSFGDNSFTLLYDNQLSILFHKIYDEFHIVASVSLFGLSCLLLVPLGHLYKVYDGKTPIASVRIPIFDMEKVKVEIEKFDELITVFKLMKIDRLFYHKGKVIGKGIRFYLVQAILDENGIIISSPSFPSLVKITSAIYKLDITFESKKKIYMFILGMLLFDDRYIVDMLNVLREMILPNRIDHFDWNKMAHLLNIDSKTLTAEYIIFENNKKFCLIFDDPKNHTVRVIKENREKRLTTKGFDDVYLNLNPDLPIYDQFVI